MLIVGTEQSDALSDTSEDDTIRGGAGADNISVTKGGNDVVYGEDGEDTIGIRVSGPVTSLYIDGGAGADTITFGGLVRLTTPDRLTIIAGSGSDYIEAYYFKDLELNAGDGIDFIRLSLTGNSTITLGSGQDLLYPLEMGSLYSGTMNILDFATGDDGDRIIFNNHPLYTANPFTDGNLKIYQSGSDVVLEVNWPGTSADYIRFANHTVSEFTASNLGGWSPLGGPQQGLMLAAGDISTRLEGGSGGDSISGGARADTLYGYAGDDSIRGGDGMDNIAGGAGADFIQGDAGSDGLEGGDDDDVLWGGDGNDYVYGGAGFDQINGNTGNDFAWGGDGADWVVGGKDNDALYGEAGDDIVYGNLGDDGCFGGPGADWVRGGQGDDFLNGGEGDDWLSGDRGTDTVVGAQGADKFYFFSGAGVDRVTDFSSAEGDKVLLDRGQTYTLSYTAEGAIIDLGNGDQMILAGVTAGNIGEWLLFN